MQRKTITLNDELFRMIQRLRASIIRNEDVPLDDISFTTTVNMVLFGGMVGRDDFSEETWGMIRSFLADQEEALERASLTDMQYERMLKKLFG